MAITNGLSDDKITAVALGDGKDYTTVNIVALNDVISSMNSALELFLTTCDGDVASNNENFITLSNIEVDGPKALASGFDDQLEGIATNIHSVIGSLTEYVNQVEANDSSLGEKIPLPPKKTRTTVTEEEQKQFNEILPPETQYDPSHAEFFKTISLNDLSNVLYALTYFADANQMTVEQLLLNVQSGDNLKELLLSQPNISDELRSYLENTPSDILLKDLQVLLYNQALSSEIFNFDDETTSFLEEFTTTTLTLMDGNQTGEVSIDDVFGNSQVLKEKLYRLEYYMTNTFSGIGEYDIQKVLLNLYDSGEATGGLTQVKSMLEGTEDKDIFVNYIRTEIDSMAKKNGVTYEVLLTDEKYQQDLMTIPINLDKLLLYGEIMARTDNPSKMWFTTEQEKKRLGCD